MIVGEAVTGSGSLLPGTEGLGRELEKSDSGSNRSDSGTGFAEAGEAIMPSCEGPSNSDSGKMCRSGGRTTPLRTRRPLRSLISVKVSLNIASRESTSTIVFFFMCLFALLLLIAPM